MKKKVCFLVGELNSANGICAQAVMGEMNTKGYDVFCITNKLSRTPAYEVINGIKIYRIKPRLSFRLNDYNQSLKNESVFIKILGYILNKFKLLMSFFSWPLVSPLYSLRFYKSLSDLNSRENIDIVIPIYTQIDTMIASSIFKLRNKSTYYIPYFLDSLSGGYGPKIFSRRYIIRRGLLWEKLLLTNADKIVVMESSRKHHEVYSVNKNYYNKFVYLDIPLLIEGNINALTTSFLNDTKFNLVYMGTLPCKIRNPEYLLKILSKLNCNDTEVTFIGSISCHEIFEDYMKSDFATKINIRDFVEHEVAINILNEADILINIGNSLDTMIPSKIFEYMSVRKPILSTHKAETDPSLQYLSKYPFSLSVFENDIELDKNVEEVKKFLNNVRNNIDYIDNKLNLKCVYYKNTPKAFIDVIEGI